jgi:2-amino-4-hydroxy-6-hydroxymethyldihydropteridine diphosphokinase
LNREGQRVAGSGQRAGDPQILPATRCPLPAPPQSVLIALGTNLGDRRYHIARAIHALGEIMRVVRVSSIRETAPVDAPAGSPPFLNAVVAGYTTLSPETMLAKLLDIEQRLGRVRRGVPNEPRVIDLDLIFHGAHRRKTRTLTLPHPRYREREFVLTPIRELRIDWV